MDWQIQVDQALSRAATIPSWCYTDPATEARERDRIFAHTWQLVGRAEQVREHGQFFTAEVGNDAIVVVRDRDALRGY